MAKPAWHNLDIPEIYQQLGTRPEGLTEAEVSQHLAQNGRNEITRRKPVSPWRLLFKQFANYFILVLFFAAILAFSVSYLPGESGRRLTAYFILGIIVLSVTLNFFEEYRAQKELEALDRLLVFKTTVLRMGIPQQIDAAEVVPAVRRSDERQEDPRRKVKRIQLVTRHPFSDWKWAPRIDDHRYRCPGCRKRFGFRQFQARANASDFLKPCTPPGFAQIHPVDKLI